MDSYIWDIGESNLKTIYSYIRTGFKYQSAIETDIFILESPDTIAYCCFVLLFPVISFLG